ncbi:hypothetical protein D9619_005898 [Psilocybe cf. subviscida]|uniref:Uncharacterized protein n=1 Tax=Psilocybe cf. subviscida TaxID=2480587 RepID=A0A8H5BYY5_9AGAR|nr:hypothetical protein D9619_005898 [Psilocybe cf. subviscida]
MYVILPFVEKAADEVVRTLGAFIASPGDAPHTVDSFRQTFAGVFDGGEDEEYEGEERPSMRERDAVVLLKSLERDRGGLVVDKDVTKSVNKNAAPDERMITAIDHGILELKSAIRNLHMQVDLVQRKIDERTKKASAALQQKRKPVALSNLRARKRLEDLLNRRIGSLRTRDSTHITVKTAAGDVKIMKSYEPSTATLCGILAHPSLARSNVDRTLKALEGARQSERRRARGGQHGAYGR